MLSDKYEIFYFINFIWFILVSIFDQLFDEDDEDDEFKPDNFENDEEDDEELSVCNRFVI